MRVLVTGGTSPVGAALARQLVSDGHHVRILSRGKDHHRLAGLECGIMPGDVRDAAAVTDAAEGCDAVVHAAFAPVTAPPRELLDVAVSGMMNVLDACEYHVIRTLMLVSSPLAGDPQPGTYGAGKLAAELLAERQADWLGRLVIARPFNVYGPDCGYNHVIPQAILRMQELIRSGARGPLPFRIQGDGTEIRSFMYVDDCAKMLTALLSGDAGVVRCDAGTDDERQIASIPLALAGLFGREIAVIPSPRPPGVPCRRVPEKGQPPETPFADGMARTVAWYRQHDREAVHD